MHVHVQGHVLTTTFTIPKASFCHVLTTIMIDY